MTLMEWLISVDKTVFSFIQTHLIFSWLNGFMILVRNPLTWIPLYIFMLYWTFKRNRSNALKFICLTVLCFAITDFSCAHLFKPLFERLRPCYDEDTIAIVHGLVNCGGKYSFPSSHAANHFGLASFWFYSIRFTTGQKWRWLWIWAALIGFAQVYVGVHFPLDILGGTILGLLTGISLVKLYRVWSGSHSAILSDNSPLSLH